MPVAKVKVLRETQSLYVGRAKDPPSTGSGHSIYVRTFLVNGETQGPSDPPALVCG